MKGYLFKTFANGSEQFFMSSTPELKEGSKLSYTEPDPKSSGEYVVYSYHIDNYTLSGVTNIKNVEISQVDYNKPSPEDAFAAGNFVRVTFDWTGEERYDSEYNRYSHDYVVTLDFGPNFDNSTNSVFVSSGAGFNNFMQMFETSEQEFTTNDGCGSFRLGDYNYSCLKGYDTQGGYLDIKFTPTLVGPGTGYKCSYDGESGWYAAWNGGFN